MMVWFITDRATLFILIHLSIFNVLSAGSCWVRIQSWIWLSIPALQVSFKVLTWSLTCVNLEFLLCVDKLLSSNMLFYQFIFEWRPMNNCWMNELKWHKTRALCDSLQDDISYLKQWATIKGIEFNKNKCEYQLHKLGLKRQKVKTCWFSWLVRSVWVCVMLWLPPKATELTIPSVLPDHIQRTEFRCSTVFLQKDIGKAECFWWKVTNMFLMLYFN